MPGDHQNLSGFIQRCRSRFGYESAKCNEEGGFVTLKETTVHIREDEDAARVVFWIDIGMPPHGSFEAVEQAAKEYASERFLDCGCILGVNRAAQLIVFGRSLDASVLSQHDALRLIEQLANEAPSVSARLAATQSRALTRTHGANFGAREFPVQNHS